MVVCIQRRTTMPPLEEKLDGHHPLPISRYQEQLDGLVNEIVNGELPLMPGQINQTAGRGGRSHRMPGLLQTGTELACLKGIIGVRPCLKCWQTWSDPDSPQTSGR